MKRAAITRMIKGDDVQLHRPKYRTYEEQFPLESLKPSVATEVIKIRCEKLQGRVLKRGIASRIVWGKLRPQYKHMRGGYKLLGKAPLSPAVVEFACDCPDCRDVALSVLKYERGFIPTAPRRVAR
jgi:hypothetical protein